MAGSSSEFSLIEQYFRPLAGPAGLSLLDDCAQFTPPLGESLILSKDLMVAGVHFPMNAPAHLIAERALRASLSDLCASAGSPLGYLVGLSLTRQQDADWVAGFAAGLKAAQTTFSLSLMGGDTVSGDQLCISVTVVGSSARPLSRAGAQVGDQVYVTGSLGGAAAALPVVLEQPGQDNAGLDCYWRPTPRFDVRPLLQQVATAALDVSDGLASDIGHICRASAVGVTISSAHIPVADGATLKQALSGGDDYELVFTAPPEADTEIRAFAKKKGLEISRIGRIITEGQWLALDDGKTVPLSDYPGYDHTSGW